MIPKFRAWFGPEMYDKPVVYDGKFYLDWREFEDGNTYNGAILMQSTGLLDKNGQEIFEGDIVRISMRIGRRTTTSIGAVEFDKFEVCFRIRNELGGHYVTMFHTRYFEVIGNVYEHNHLLK